MWRQDKEDIGWWLETKECGFARDQNKNLQISREQWLQRYIFTNLHEILFVDFPIVLDEWL